MATEIGVISVVVGTVSAITAEGGVRILQVGDKVFAEDLISTGPTGAVEVIFVDGSLMDLGRSSQALLDSEMYDPTAVADNEKLQPEDITTLQQAILAGQDSTEVTEATAAGVGVQDGNTGHDAVFVDYLAPEMIPDAGFDTIGVASAFPIIEEEQTLDGPVSTKITLTDLIANEGDGTARITASVGNPVTGSPLIITLNNGAIVTIPVGATSAQSTPFPVQDDDPYIDPESYIVGISDVTGGGDSFVDKTDTATVTIKDTIDATTVTLNPVNVAENETITYSASVDNAPETDLTITLNNGVDILIKAGELSGSSEPQAAQGEDVYVDAESNTISIASSSGGNYEELDTTDTATVTISDTVDTTTVTLNDVSVDEDGSITYSASVDNAPETDLTITLNNGVTITIAAGETSGSSEPQDAQGEDVYTDGESYTVSIDSTSGGNYEELDTTDTATVTISDTVDTTTVTLNDVSVDEDGSITYTASVDNAPETDLTITLNNGVDILIKAGELSGSSEPQPAQGEDVYVDAESNTISIASSSGGNYEDLDTTDTATVTINDTVDTVTATLSTNTTEVSGGGGSIEYVITLTGSLGDIDPDQDLVFTLENGEEITIAAGATSGSVTSTYTDAELTTQTSISNSISAVKSGGDEYENLATTGSTDVTVNYAPIITNNNGVSVDEDDLTDGTDTDKESTTQSGSFTISAQDGVGDLSIDGHTIISNGVFTATSFTTGYGNTLTVSDYDSSTGEITYSYTLNNNTLGHMTDVDNDGQPDDNGENITYEDLNIVFSDSDGSSVNDTLRAEIIDDAPIAENDTDTTDNAVATGNVITDMAIGDTDDTDSGQDAVGADGAKVTRISFGTVDMDVSTSSPQGTTIQGDYGSLTIYADGSYEYKTTSGVTLSGGEVDTFTYMITDDDGDTSSATLAIDVINASPAAVEASGSGIEDSSGIAVTLSGSDADGSIDSFVIENLPIHGTLYYQGEVVSAGDEISAQSNSATLSFVPDHDWSGATAFDFHAVDNNGGSSASTNAAITVTPVTDTPTVSLSVGAETVLSNSITIDNVHETDSGFVVTAYDIDGNESTVSTFDSLNVQGLPVSGYGVAAAAPPVPGAMYVSKSVEIQQANGKSEKLVIAFDQPVTDVAVAFTWLADNENAAYVLKDANGNPIGSGMVRGVTDSNNDPMILISEGLVSSIEFTAPGAEHGGDVNDDFLIHEVTYTSGKTLPLEVTAQAVDIDQSEDITSITVAVTDGVDLSHGTIIGSDNGMTIWQLPDSPDGDYSYSYDSSTDKVVINGLSMTVPTDVTGQVTVTATVTAKDGSAMSQTDSATDTYDPPTTPVEPDNSVDVSVYYVKTSGDTPLLLTFTDLTDSSKTFSTYLNLSAPTGTAKYEQFTIDTDFKLDNTHKYLVSVNTILEGRTVDISYFSVAGVTIVNSNTGSVKHLGEEYTAPGHNYGVDDHSGFTQVIQPGVAATDDVTLSTDSTVNPAGPTTAAAQGGADVPMLDGTTNQTDTNLSYGTETLVGDDGVNVIRGGWGG